MAPEILMEGRISKAGDLYAFGITLWEVSLLDQTGHGTVVQLPACHLSVDKALLQTSLGDPGPWMCVPARAGSLVLQWAGLVQFVHCPGKPYSSHQFKIEPSLDLDP
jgi:hypothetical protein